MAPSRYLGRHLGRRVGHCHVAAVGQLACSLGLLLTGLLVLGQHDAAPFCGDFQLLAEVIPLEPSLRFFEQRDRLRPGTVLQFSVSFVLSLPQVLQLIGTSLALALPVRFPVARRGTISRSRPPTPPAIVTSLPSSDAPPLSASSVPCADVRGLWRPPPFALSPAAPIHILFPLGDSCFV
jgi:hypothetical protein